MCLDYRLTFFYILCIDYSVNNLNEVYEMYNFYSLVFFDVAKLGIQTHD